MRVINSSKVKLVCDKSTSTVAFAKNKYDSDSYCTFIDINKTYKGDSNVNCNGVTEITEADPSKTYYAHVVSKKPSAISDIPSSTSESSRYKIYNWSGSAYTGAADYFLASHRNGGLLRSSTINNSSDTVPIPSDYTFALGAAIDSRPTVYGTELTAVERKAWDDRTSTGVDYLTLFAHRAVKGLSALYR